MLKWLRYRPEHDVKPLDNSDRVERNRPEHDVKLHLNRTTEFSCHIAHLSTCMRSRKNATTSSLHVRRVFIMDGCDELITEWLNFVKDIVDLEDLPLNISRETLQQNKILRVIRKNHVMKYLEMFAEISEKKDDYKKYHEQFVECMKLGIHVNSVDDFEIAELLRINTSKSGDEQISMKEYIDRMKEDQNDIYYITGESRIPECLNFIKGVVDSEDPPLNIPLETLQQNKILRQNILDKYGRSVECPG